MRVCSVTLELESTQGSAAAMFLVLSWGALTLALVVVVLFFFFFMLC